MIYYTFIGVEILTPKPIVLGTFEGVIFYNITDIVGARQETHLPNNLEAVLISSESFNNATYLRDRVLPDGTEMTKEQLDTGFEVRKLIKKLKLKKILGYNNKECF